MARAPASGRMRERLKALMDGKDGTAGGGSDLVRLAARLIIEEALESEAAWISGNAWGLFTF